MIYNAIWWHFHGSNVDNVNFQNDKAISLIKTEVCDKVYLFKSTSKSGSSLTFRFAAVYRLCVQSK